MGWCIGLIIVLLMLSGALSIMYFLQKMIYQKYCYDQDSGIKYEYVDRGRFRDSLTRQWIDVVIYKKDGVYKVMTIPHFNEKMNLVKPKPN